MKKFLHNKTRIVLLSLAVFALLGGAVLAQHQELFRKSRNTAQRPEQRPMPVRTTCVYEYNKLAYGSVEDAGGNEGMYRVSDIPQEVVDRLSTECLFQSVLKYPGWGHIAIRNTPQQGFDKIRENFHALDSLLKRPDAGEVILKHYQTVDLNRLKDVHDVRPSDPFAYDLNHELYHLEFMLGQPEIVNDFSHEQKVALLQALVDKAVFKNQHVGELEYFSSWDFETITITAARVMLTIPSVKFQGLMNKDEGLKHFVETFQQPSPNVLQIILDAAQKAINGEPVSSVESALAFDMAVLPDFRPVETMQFQSASQAAAYIPPCDPKISRQINIYTPKGTKLSVCQMSSDLPLSVRQRYDKDAKSRHPKAILLRGSTRLYNCHSYAWHSQYQYSNIWVNSPGDDAYWLDGSYKQTTFKKSAIPDFAVSYQADDHSARTVSKTDTNTFVSKWGQWPLMKHTKGDCPYDSSRLAYYDQERR